MLQIYLVWYFEGPFHDFIIFANILGLLLVYCKNILLFIKQALKFSEDPRSGVLKHTLTNKHTHTHTQTQRGREREKFTSRS